jgi:biofilm PGA synthesis N-glycosyltransferase PgaC
MLYIFIGSCFLIFYNIAGYAIIAAIINKLKSNKRTAGDTNYRPSVSFIVAAYNEEDCIGQKILNSFDQDYPADKIEYLFITDGSSDKTPAIVSQYPSIRLLHQPERKGKPAAMNRAIQHATGEILIFSDANTVLNKAAVSNIVRHYANPKVGGVSGEKKVASPSGTTHEVGTGEGLYWKYESLLKRIDSEFYSVAGAAGELFSVRKSLYEPMADNTILDDFVVSLKVAQKGYRIIYEPNAFATELPSASLKDEQKRKIRISAGGFQSIAMLADLLLFWKQPRLSFIYISHRVLRWTVTPLCLILAFLSNLVLMFLLSHPGISLLFAAQCLFYAIAVLAKLFPRPVGQIKLFKLPYYFVFMNVSVIQGFFRFLRGRQTILWEKAKREPYMPKQ